MKILLKVPHHCSIVYENFISYVDLKLWLVRIVKFDVYGWRIFANCLVNCHAI